MGANNYLDFLLLWTVFTLFVVLSHGTDLHTAAKKLPRRPTPVIDKALPRSGPKAADVVIRPKPVSADGWSEEAVDSRDSEDGEEMVDIETELKSNGDVNLKFSSHGRKHLLELTESKKRLADIPIKLVGSSDEFTQEVTSQLKNIRMMRDRKRGASVSFQVVDGEPKPLIKKGTYQLGKHQFEIVPDSLPSRSKVTKQLLKDDPTRKFDNIVLPSQLRQKREIPREVTPISATVELAMIMDYSIWSSMSSGDILAVNQTDHTVNLLLYYAHMAEIMNDRYNSMKNDDIHISVDIAGMVVITSDSELTILTEDDKTNDKVDASSTLGRLSTWLNSTEAEDTLPPNDHVMLFTAYDVYQESDGSTGSVGFAGKRTICDTQLSSSLVEVGRTLSFDAFAASYVLGLSLGADNDGDSSGSSGGCGDNSYIMGAFPGNERFRANRFLFGCCSQRSFYATITDVGGCLLTNTADSNHPSSIDDNVATYLPGQIFSADDQCYMESGTAACIDGIYDHKNVTICIHLWCVWPSDTSYCYATHIAAADGTECDVGKWCSQGECVDKGQTYTQTDQNCDVTHCYANETLCIEGVNIRIPQMFQCYSDSNACDGVHDCSDGSDERDCSEDFTCPTGYTKCVSGRRAWDLPPGVPLYCIDDKWICDGESGDCIDGSDEEALCMMSSSTTPTKLTSSSTTLRKLTSSSTTPKKLTSSSTTPRKLTSSSTTPRKQTSSPTTPKKLTSSSTTPRELPSSSTTPRKLMSSSTTPKKLTSSSTTPRKLTSSSTTPRGLTSSSTTASTIVTHCDADETPCIDGVNIRIPQMFQCYLDSNACDGVPDCSDGSDETDCSEDFTCPTGYTKCVFGRSAWDLPPGVPLYCIDNTWKCDGESGDCTDRSDEDALCKECYFCKDTKACITLEKECTSTCPDDKLCVDNVRKITSSAVKVFNSVVFNTLLFSVQQILVNRWM